MRPEPRDVHAQSAFAAALSEQDRVSGLHDGRGRDASDRFAVYRNTVLAASCEALAARFPATRRLLGGPFFDAAAADYARASRPSSPVLSAYGETFPDALAALEGLAAYPFVIEAARIEAAHTEAYHAADAAPLPADALSQFAPGALADLVLRAHPATRLVDAPRGGLTAWAANQDPPREGLDGAVALLTRPHQTVRVMGLDAPAATFARRLIAGAPLAEAATLDGLELSGALASLLSMGAFADVSVAQRP
ncbi:DNA-binding domain-containing protein [Acuticoccus sp. M5D2P5]|uniref:HvfC/BufC N-terminal domain-containing protein n=1 Tax=Acuticoccus kalidii TaxID=2910977 RepID=UPI001F1CF38F|nr:DNA-binding domain-containing protein [Acuticoccus kalidii]MCF3935801.1 DNA-binding domain-containing protein [Acuticoccus kalidii]